VYDPNLLINETKCNYPTIHPEKGEATAGYPHISIGD